MKATEKQKAYMRAWYAANKEHKIAKDMEWRKANSDKVKGYYRKYRASDKGKASTQRYLSNPETYKRRWENTKNNPNALIRAHLTSRIWNALIKQRAHKKDHLVDLLGCTIEELRKYLELKFVGDMSWENYGEWHIDHIRPCSSFDLTDQEQQKQCFHYTNLQPLWAADNIRKYNHWEEAA